MIAAAVRPQVERGEVVALERLGELIELTVRLPHLAATAQPGQFAQLRCADSIVPLLRRPFSVAWTDGDSCSFVFNEVGAGTRLLARLRAGDPLDALGPLGRGFSVQRVDGPVVCVAGGVGCAPFPFLIRALRDRGVHDIRVFNGAATASRLYPAGRFARGVEGVHVREATDDGSRGHRGYVTELVALQQEPETAAVFACGPNVMLAALASLLDSDRRSDTPVTEVSLEAPMGCGFGTCLGCALPVRSSGTESAWALCCTDGPVMDMAEVDWPSLLQLPGADVA